MEEELTGLESDVLTHHRHPKTIAAGYVASALIQGLKAHHLILVRGKGDRRRIKAALSHLELAHNYGEDGIRALRSLLAALSDD